MRFLGMLELPDIKLNGIRLSQLSGLAWDHDDNILYAISDKGTLFHLRPRFKRDILTGLQLLNAVKLETPGSTKTQPHTATSDSEGLTLIKGRNGRRGDAELIVSFERYPHIVRYRTDGKRINEYTLSEPISTPKNYSSKNKMLESVCVDPVHGILTTPERPLSGEIEGYSHLFNLSGKSWLYPLADNVRITDLECLGNGRVLVLEQIYRKALNQVTVTLKQVELPDTPRPTPLTPVTLFTLDNHDGFVLDNFEGLTRHEGMRFFMVSDNNDLFFQRTLLLYFEILDE